MLFKIKFSHFITELDKAEVTIRHKKRLAHGLRFCGRLSGKCII